MFVVSKGTVPFLAALALGYSEIEVVVAFGSFYIEKVRPFTGTDRLGVHILGISLLSVGALVIFTVNTFVRFYVF